MGFSILSIWLFINSLLKVHLERIKPNLGTFKAFGLSNQFLTNAYLRIIIAFISKASGLAIVGIISVFLIDWLITGGQTNFDFNNKWILFAVLALVFISLLFSKRTIDKILEETPGNLIYGRD